MARTAVRAQRGAAGRAQRPSGQARDAPIPQGLPSDQQCTRPRCGERLEYLATEQVHLYRASTNGRPVQQSYTLTGTASIGPPTGKHQGKGPEPATRTPPHPPQPGRPGHDTRETLPQATRKRDRRRRARKGDNKGTHHQQTPARGGGEPHSRDRGGARHTAPTPNRAAKPRPERRGQAPKHTTNTPHTRPSVHTTHTLTTATDTSPTNAHHTPKRRRRPHHTRNTHKPKQQEPSNPPRQGGCRAARNR